MAKEVAAFIKLQIKGGAANPSPPVGPALFRAAQPRQGRSGDVGSGARDCSGQNA